MGSSGKEGEWGGGGKEIKTKDDRSGVKEVSDGEAGMGIERKDKGKHIGNEADSWVTLEVQGGRPFTADKERERKERE
jgi:hypothetical protein